MKPKKNLVWLASYPKSGNTWFRIFLSNYMRDADSPVDINDLDSTPIASARSLFDEVTGLSSSDMTSEEIDNLRPDVFRAISRNSEELSFHKIHDAYTLNENGEPIVPMDSTKAVIYFIRNPLDVAVSFAHHSAVDVQKSIENINDSSFTFCGKGSKLANQLRQRLLSWSEHMESWRKSGLPMLILRYEDMLADTENQFGRAIEFCGLEYDLKRLQKAIRFSSIEEVQKQEKEKGFKEKAQKSVSFFRKGVSDDWKNRLTRNQIESILSKHSSLMDEFNYFVKEI